MAGTKVMKKEKCSQEGNGSQGGRTLRNTGTLAGLGEGVCFCNTVSREGALRKGPWGRGLKVEQGLK